MIQQELNKTRNILILLSWICFFLKAKAQTDTVYVYEDVVIYDTVVVYDTVFIRPDITDILPLKPKSINILRLDTFYHQADLLGISDQQAATFPINHIILDENYSKNIKNSESMKKINFFGVVLFAFQSIIAQTGEQDVSTLNNPQIKRFGAFLTAGASIQIHSYPNIMNYDNVHLTTDEGNRNFVSEEEFGKYAEGYLPIIGFGLNYSIPINSWIFFKPQVGYLQKGCSYRGHVLIKQTDSTITSVSYGDEGEKFKYNNRFHYLTSDLLLILKTRRWKTKLFFQTGLRNEFLIYYNIQYDIDFFSEDPLIPGLYETSYPANSHYNDFNRFNVGMVNGFGLEFDKGWFIELNTNFDFGYLVKNTDLKVRNLISTLTVGINF